ncbi:MAG: NADH-quinone oxidoreductase subunit H [Flammeovirgaceae bacterium]|nr:NADH-quinone oxidoreductase subunit H [Flammeovirgaceae bacterium]
MVIAFVLLLLLVVIYTVFAVYIERKVSAFAQDRLGPMEVGKFGVLQTVADLLKLIQKEDIIPKSADKFLFLIAPVVIFTAVFSGFAIIPLTSGIIGSMASVGVFYLLAVISLDVLGILMAGWGSNNKYTIYGAMRSVAQIVSYEVPLGISILCVVMICQTLNLQEISFQQGIWMQQYQTETVNYTKELNYLFGIKKLGIEVTNIGGILTWNIVRMPLLFFVFIIFFISSLAEANRTPFDLPEAESELIGGFHTEYTGFRWSMVMLSEYGMMLLVSFLAAILFFGGWNTPFPNISEVKLAEWTSGLPGSVIGNIWGIFWLLFKVFSLILIQMWIRWTYPRLRVDQLMSLCWKYLTPFALVLLFICAIWRLLMI